MFSRWLKLCLVLCAWAGPLSVPVTSAEFSFQSLPTAAYSFHGFTGERIEANVQNWLLPAPAANPGLISMFHLRDRQPKPNLVPWAGEFSGKYLISAIQALRMSKDPHLPDVVAQVIRQLIASQAEDGYLGPFRKEERLRGHWDLWGHYHCMLGLLMWHERTGDPAALNTARRAADLVCNTYLDTGRRAIEAGSDEMNLSIIHALGWIYRITKEDRYLRMMREIEKDWEQGGDYLRAGLAGTEFFQSKRPRWESLHNIQGLVELYRITGDLKYRHAFENLWRSIARWDVRNTGGFSSGEQATGNPYAPTPIETCCTIAWMALSIDMLSLGGDARAADMLELATFNAWAGAQHPSGRWCTYNTPMDGAREASAHTIVFQSRHGTPELNCCSVNGPRGWGMLSEWAVMRSTDGLILNWLAPAEFSLPSNELLRVEGDYPVNGRVVIQYLTENERESTLQVRIPGWSLKTKVRLNGAAFPDPQPGHYFTLRRAWKKSDRLELDLDLSVRAVPGAKEAAHHVSVYRGPLLLAADQRFNSFDEPPRITPASLHEATLLPIAEPTNSLDRIVKPLLLLGTKSMDGSNLVLCDFASAGAGGTRYRSWLPSTNFPPAPVVTRTPQDSTTLPTGTILFRWTGPRNSPEHLLLQISTNADTFEPLHTQQAVTNREALVAINKSFNPDHWYYWRVIRSNQFGVTTSSQPAARFRVDPNLPPAQQQLTSRKSGPNGQLVSFPENISVNGTEKRAFPLEEWPEENYTVSFSFRLHTFPTNRIGQLFSAWNSPMNDPLRLTVDNGKLFARIEAGATYSTQGVPLELNRWYSVVAKKEGSKLTLVLDGKERGSCTIPEFINTSARDFAFGGNPHYSGNEFVHADFKELSFSEQ